ncbi:putative RNA methyltransferase [Clostridium sp. KNHs214]|uniref:putative RNA methyltransferase n=1 Tax=Clostridium sp. KNHs214 TaxID=1540257 RepID=UPI00068B1E71|nr:hypothetical protein [Clostridium sp. KNHs214]
MDNFLCPVCRKQLNLCNKSLSCENKHSFDLAKIEYVNLLLSKQKKGKQHGDDKLMVRARRDFLNKEYFASLLKKLSELIKKYVWDGCVILYAGCGECWYTANIYEYFIAMNWKALRL